MEDISKQKKDQWLGVKNALCLWLYVSTYSVMRWMCLLSDPESFQWNLGVECEPNASVQRFRECKLLGMQSCQ
jgi:hypothetical protein